MVLSSIIPPLLFLILGFFFSKYCLLIFEKLNLTILVDDQFKKPQAFHENSTYRIGGIIFFCLLILVFSYFYVFKNFFLVEYFLFSIFFFSLGLIDDLKIKIAPKFRLIIMTTSLVVLILFNDIYIKKTGLEFLDYLMSIDIFSLIFICLCFLFIINGSNLIDGFNGLLGIHSLIIFTVLFFINFYSGNVDLMYSVFYFLLITLILLKFNFPNAKVFFGDSGAYLIGVLITLSVINSSNLNPSISPFFFCILLFYLFFEVFFSFFRKLIFVRQSPLFPDSQHLHMSLYKLLVKKSGNKNHSNYITSIYINVIYLILILPGIFYMHDGLFCRYYFLVLLIFYMFFYKLLYKKT